ncbi:MAG: hypothetical protein ACOZF2_11455 [Thermodesulfobacteriota bacterium]
MARDEILRAMRFLHPEGSVFELCAIGVKQPRSPLWEGHAGGKRNIVAGWFQDHHQATDLAFKLDQVGAEGIYITLNPCNPALLARANHRLIAGVGRTQDSEILSLLHLLVDVDPKRPKGISATDAEHEAALQLVLRIKEGLSEKGWPEPLVADSGNGGHLIYKVNLDNTKDNVELLKKCLQAIAEQHSTENLDVDMTVFNPSRLCKLYGTNARKGDNIQERPHRSARIL